MYKQVNMVQRLRLIDLKKMNQMLVPMIVVVTKIVSLVYIQMLHYLRWLQVVEMNLNLNQYLFV